MFDATTHRYAFLPMPLALAPEEILLAAFTWDHQPFISVAHLAAAVKLAARKGTAAAIWHCHELTPRHADNLPGLWVRDVALSFTIRPRRSPDHAGTASQRPAA